MKPIRVALVLLLAVLFAPPIAAGELETDVQVDVQTGIGTGVAEIPTWNLPDALPATIQSYLDDSTRCPKVGQATHPGCHLVLPCGLYEFTSTATFPIHLKDGPQGEATQNVVISGCGMNGTRIRWIDPPNTGSSRLLMIDDASRWITLRDLVLDLQCNVGCTLSTIAAAVDGGVKDVTFERVHFHAERATGGVTTNPVALQIGIAAEAAERISAYGCRIHANGYGLSAVHCEDCWFDANWLGANLLSGGPPAYGLAQKKKGSGVRFTNNTFDMAGDVRTGLYLRPGDAATTASTAQVLGNSFINLAEDNVTQGKQRAIWLYGYNRANISGNLFACETGVTACDSYAIATTQALNCPAGDDCNEHNLITDNVFERLVDDNVDGAWTQCPVHFFGGTGFNQNNVVRGNVFMLGTGSAAGSDGCCGPNVGLNDCATNDVFGP